MFFFETQCRNILRKELNPLPIPYCMQVRVCTYNFRGFTGTTTRHIQRVSGCSCTHRARIPSKIAWFVVFRCCCYMHFASICNLQTKNWKISGEKPPLQTVLPLAPPEDQTMLMGAPPQQRFWLMQLGRTWRPGRNGDPFRTPPCCDSVYPCIPDVYTHSHQGLK